MKPKGIFLLAGVLLAVLLAGCEQPGEQALPPRPVLVVHPQPAHEGSGIYPGEVLARFQPELAFRVSGKIIQRTVQTGQRVRAGELLAELDPADLRLQVQAMQAQQVEAQAGLALARDELQRYQTLYERGLLSQSQLDSLRTTEKSARARLQQAEAALANAQNQLEYSHLRAPEDGVIARVLAEAGQVVAAGQPVFVLAADGPREVEFSVPEQAYAAFSIGQRVEVTLLNQPDTRLPGMIRELAQVADPRSRTYSARVGLADAIVELGQSARVHVSGPAGPSWLLPLSAIDGEGEQAVVWRFLPESGRVQRQQVRMTSFDERFVRIDDGVQAGDWLVAAGVHLLQDGQQVRALDADNRAVAAGSED